LKHDALNWHTPRGVTLS